MAAFIKNDVTLAGLDLVAKGQTGKEIHFTRIALGDGSMPDDTEARSMEALAGECVTVGITSITAPGNGEVVIRGNFGNGDLDVGFFYREIGAFAIDPDTGQEVLYCYGNAGNQAEWIPPTGGQNLIEKAIRICTIVGNACNITAHIQSGLTLTPDDLEAHNQDPDAHPNRGPNRHIGTITHEFPHTPMFALYKTDHAFGTQRFGAGPFGGGPSRTVSDAYEVGFGGKVDVFSTYEFGEGAKAVRHSKNQVAFLYDGSPANLLLKMR